jgi:hypothetical protein
MILKCSCESKFQDAAHGNKMRAHNPIRKEPLGQHWRCTVCKAEHSKGSGTEDNSKKKGGKSK